MLWLCRRPAAAQPKQLDASSKPFFVAPAGGYAVLFSVAALGDLSPKLDARRDDITHVYVITDSADAYVEARERIGGQREVSMLYRDYLRNFRINTPRNV